MLTPMQIDSVLRYLPLFESPDFSPGEVILEPGYLPWFNYNPIVFQFIKTLYEENVVFGFDWPGWKDASIFANHPEAIQEATLLDLRKLLTLHVRQDRFCDGHLAAMFRDGDILAILRRLKALTETKMESERES